MQAVTPVVKEGCDELEESNEKFEVPSVSRHHYQCRDEGKICQGSEEECKELSWRDHWHPSIFFPLV